MHSSRIRTARSLTASRRICRGACMPRGMHARWACVPRGHGWHARPPVNRMTDACENITLPQTSFASGNYTNAHFRFESNEPKLYIVQESEHVLICPEISKTQSVLIQALFNMKNTRSFRHSATYGSVSVSIESNQLSQHVSGNQQMVEVLF